jgi:hypothetical protein
MSYLVWAFHLAYALKMFWKEKEVHHTGMQPRLLEADSSRKPTSPCNKRFRVGERPSCDGGLKPFGVAHGIGRREVKVVGGHHPAKTPCKGPGDGHHVWVKFCTPARLNLFEKPCPRLWTTWRQMLDHRQLEPNCKSANLRVRLWITSSGSRG